VTLNKSKKLTIGPGKQRMGEMWGGYGGDLTRQDMMETVMYPISGTNLVDLVKTRGRITDTKVEIDNHICWLIIADAEEDPRYEEYKIYLDPDIGLCPRRIERVKKDGKSTILYSKEYQEIAEGVWFPRIMEHVNYEDDIRVEMRVVKAEVKPVTEKDISVEFEPGMTVLDLASGKLIKWSGE
jgi:hypothetical protein